MSIIYENETFCIRDVSLLDIDYLISLKNNALIKEMSIGIPTLHESKNVVKDLQMSIKNNETFWIIINKENNLASGYIRYALIDESKKTAFLHFGISEECETIFTKKVLATVFKEMFSEGIHRIDAEVYEFNRISYELLKSLGFNYEGTRRDAYFYNDEYFNIIVMGLLQSDYEAVS